MSNASCLTVLIFSQAEVGAAISPSCSVNVSVLDPTVRAAARSARHAEGALIATTVYGSIRRIDEEHTAPKAAWEALGSPQWPSAQQNAQIFNASIMQKEKFEIRKTTANDALHGDQGSVFSFSVDVAANAVVAVQVPLGTDTDIIAAQTQHERYMRLAEAESQVAAIEAEIAELRASV
jgi:hypothetical protein